MSEKTNEVTVQIDRNSLHELKGEYLAVGESKGNTIQVNLASLVFRKQDLQIDAIGVERVSVIQEGASQLRCDALKQGRVVGTRVFREGIDFSVKEGTIPLRGKMDDMGMDEPGAVHLGVGYSRGKLLRLKSGDIVYRESATAVGVVFFIPFAVVAEGDVIFRKIR